MSAATSVQNFASGDWTVRAGSEQQFVERWIEFLQWTRANAPGFISARLIRDPEDGRHFVSLAEWVDLPAIERWRALPEFGSKLMACRSLCDEFRGSNYRLAAQVP